MPNRQRSNRPYPAEKYAETDIDAEKKQHIAGLMRVNHAGEIAAQALYYAQSVATSSQQLKISLQQSAKEEMDHLKWCEQRLCELNDRVSYLTAVWYLGSFGIGLFAGCFGDKWNLGFLAETEYQVVKHLDKHLAQIPAEDKRSQAILKQMRTDELHHAHTAEMIGAKNLPIVIKYLMTAVAKVMTMTAYKI